MQLQDTNGSLAEKKPTVVFVLGKYTVQRLNEIFYCFLMRTTKISLSYAEFCFG